MRQCPGPYLPEEGCVKKIIKNNKVCLQLEQLSTTLDAVPATLFAEELASKFIIIDHVFPADGQDNYYIISPKGYVVNTNVDPRNFNKMLKNKYRKSDWMIVNWGEPKVST